MQKNIVILGGGPAGMVAASHLQKRGYNTFLIEKSNQLGGHLAQWDRLFPEGIPAHGVLEEMKAALGSTKVFLNTEIRSVNRLKDHVNIFLQNGISVLADALLITTGFDLFPAQKKEEYGYGIYNQVITNAELEERFRLGAEGFPTAPQSVGFVHCVGSRDVKAGNLQCSKVCCATAVKQASEVKAMFPDANVYCFYMDLRMFGRQYEDLYLNAQKEHGVQFIRGRVSEVSENINGQVVIKAEDTLSGKPIKVTLDLLVLMCGMSPSQDTHQMAHMLSLPLGEDGFYRSKELFMNNHRAAQEGIFYAGACLGPKTLPETIAEARAAALAIEEYLEKED